MLCLIVFIIVRFSKAGMSLTQYRRWTVGPLSSAARRPIIMQFTGSLQCQINMNLVFHISEDDSEIELTSFHLMIIA